MSQQTDLGFPVKGTLSKTPFPSIVRQLAEQSTSGSLYLLHGKTKKVVFFEDGTPVFVRSNVLSECLGQRLAAEGLISQEQCDQTLEAIRRTGKKQGELLVEMGILSEGNLRYGLLSQLRFKLFEIFSWPDGKYQFKPGKTGQDFGLRMDYSSEATIAAAILETYDESRASSALADRAAQFPMYGSFESKGLELLPEEQYFFECLDGSRTVADVLEAQDAKHVPRPAALLLALLESGLVLLLDHGAEPQERPPLPSRASHDEPDDEFVPAIEASDVLTEYEDTPLPGKLPSRDLNLSDEDEEMFAGVEDSRVSTLPSEPPGATPSGGRAFKRDAESSQEVPAELLTAEFGEAEEVFDDDIELVDEDDIEIADDETALLDPVEELGHVDPLDAEIDAVETLEPDAPLSAAPDDDLLLAPGDLDADDDLLLESDAPLDAEPVEVAPLSADPDAMVDLDELDHVDLGDAAPAPEVEEVSAPMIDLDDAELEVEAEADIDPEVEGAMQFSAAETALQAGDWTTAVGHLETAYEHGVDVAELHAHLAYARFNTAPDDPGMCEHAMDLLKYAEGLNPNLDLIYAYRGAVLQAQGDYDGARATLEHALSVNPYCDLALELMDRL